MGDSNTFDLYDNAAYRHIKNVNHIKKYPLECQPLMKNYFQCLETFTGSRKDKELFNDFLKLCTEKIDYKACIEENKSKVRDPAIRRYNVREIEME